MLSATVIMSLIQKKIRAYLAAARPASQRVFAEPKLISTKSPYRGFKQQEEMGRRHAPSCIPNNYHEGHNDETLRNRTSQVVWSVASAQANSPETVNAREMQCFGTAQSVKQR